VSSARIETAPEFLEVAGLTLEILRWPGSGVPILLLHEGLGSASMWRDFPDRLAAKTGRPVIAWSRRGYGSSDVLPHSRDPDYMHIEAHGIPALLDALKIERALLLGHSDGGSIALIAAAHFPERVAGLILEAPHVYVEQLTLDSIAAIGDEYHATGLGARLGRYHRDADRVFWQWNDIWLDHSFRDWSIEALLPAISAPTLLIQGLDDEYGTMDQLRRIQTVLPKTRCLALGACGHSPHRDQPLAVLDAAADFIRTLSDD
jgi:pimeloyl-ACP methyl ester carboxylesterase